MPEVETVRRHPLPAIVAMSLVATLTVGLPATSTASAAPAELVDLPMDPSSILPLNAPDAEPDGWSDRSDALIIRPANGRSFGQVRARMAELNAGGAQIGGTVGDDGSRTIRLPADVPVEELHTLASRLESEGLADHAEPDIRMVPFVVNDPGYPDQWHLSGNGASGRRHGIDVEAAWARTSGSAEVTVAVLDTGARAHPDLDDRIIAGYDMISSATIARDGDGRDADPTDEGDWANVGECGADSPAQNSSWHGLHVAGTIGASTNNGIGVAGVDQRARIQHVRVLGRCGGLMSDISDGIRWAAGLPVSGIPTNATPADVINLSLGGSGECGRTSQSAVDAAVAAGSVVIAAAGNANIDAGNTTPGNCDGVITVAATSPAGDRAGAMRRVDDEPSVRVPYSNYGQVIDIAAPGGDNSFPGGGVLSTYNLGKKAAGGHGYASMLGTSMAAPHVAGVVSLMLDANPTLTPAQVRSTLTAQARPFGTGSGEFACSSSSSADFHCGAGVVDAGASIATAAMMPGARPSSSNLTATAGDLRATVAWSPSVTSNGAITYALHRSTGSACTPSSPIVRTQTGRSWTDTGLKHDTTYRYCLTAVDTSGARSAASNTASIKVTDLTAPAAPSLSATAGESAIDLTWTAVTDPTTPITYRLHRSTTSTCSAASTVIRTQTTRAYTDVGLEAGTTYRYCVTATDGAGNISAASASRAVSTVSPPPVCHAFVGDWNGSGRDGLGWWCDGRTKLRTANGASSSFNYGRRGDVPVVADWNGDGRETVSVIRDGTWHVNNALRGGAAERTFIYGRVSRGDVPITGRWDRGRISLPGIVRDREWHLRDEQSGGSSSWRFVYGRLTAGDLPLVGDWNGDGRDTAGIVRQGEWHLRDVHAGGDSDISYVYGRVLAGDIPVVGDWNGNRRDAPGIVRDGQWHLKNDHGGGGADRTITFRAP